jgi:hypothetical protein
MVTLGANLASGSEDGDFDGDRFAADFGDAEVFRGDGCLW